MKVLALVFHPDFSSSRITRSWADRLEREEGITVRKHEPVPPLDPRAEQEACEAHEALLFVHPLHWYSTPWHLKRWIDQTLTWGWAYGGGDHLAGKPWAHAVSVGASESEYGREGSRVFTVEEFLRPLERSAAFCQAQWRQPFLFYGGGWRPEEDALAAAEDLVRYAQDLGTTGPYSSH